MTALPKNWRHLPTDRLAPYLDDLDDSTQEYEDVTNELDDRQRMLDDPRFAEAMGAPWLEPS